MDQAGTKVCTVDISPPLAEKVDQMAERFTREALADVDAGQVIEHQAIQAWAESLGTDKPLAVPG